VWFVRILQERSRGLLSLAAVDRRFAEYIVAWESHAIPIPKSLSPEAAAPLFCAGGTVFSALA
jgi:D-arabinose 1-dehydrogenase-like Zn-dependent alcohol dehydrogenase